MSFFEVIKHNPVNSDQRGSIYKFISYKSVKEVISVKGNNYSLNTTNI